MSLARIGVLVAAVAAASSLVVPVAQAAPAQGSSGLAFTAVSPTRLHDTRVTGDRIAARGNISVGVPQVPDDAVAVLVNVTGTNPAGPTFLTVLPPGNASASTSTVNLRAGETRANLAVVPIGRPMFHGLSVIAGPNAVDAVIDLAGYYSPSGAAKYTPQSPQRVLDTRDATPVGPNGTVTLDLSGKVPAGATAATFNLTATNVTAPTVVTAYPDGQARPTASNLNPVPGENTPNLVTVGLSADRKVTLANSFGSVDLIADLAGYYSPQSTQAFYPLMPLRVLDTRGPNEEPREPITGGQEHHVDLTGWLPAGATAAVFNLTATNVSTSTFLTAHPADQPRSSASTLNVVAGQAAANLATVAVSPDRAVNIYNFLGQADVLVDLAGYFAPALPPCQRGCLYGFGGNVNGEAGNGVTNDFEEPTPTATVYGLDSVVDSASGDRDRYALRTDGTVWAWGWGSDSGLGNGPAPHGDVQGSTFPPGVYATLPVQVSGLTNIVAVSNKMALRSDHTVWVWGGNAYKHLGPGYHFGEYDTPVQVTELTDVVAITSDGGDNYAVKSDGTVWSWGWNTRGELGNGTSGTEDTCIGPNGISDQGPNCASGLPVQVVGLQNVTHIAPRLAVKSDGTLWQWGPRDYPRQDNAPVQVSGMTNAVSVAASGAKYVLRADGTVWAWGNGYNGQLGDGISHETYVDGLVRVKDLTGVRAIAAGIVSGYALMSDGTEYAWGGGQDGALGDGQYFSKSLTPVRVPGVSGATALGSNGYAIVGS